MNLGEYMKKASMQDIADALGISKNSVSQALRNMPGVSQQTRMLVKNKADELGYHYKKLPHYQKINGFF